MTIKTDSNIRVKHFQATCPITRISIAAAYSNATSRSARNFLSKVIKQLPFPVLSIQVDGGAEFMKEFEQACSLLNIPLFVLPPRSPKCNANVERANGTFRYEFYQSNTFAHSIGEINNKLQEFQGFYNSFRPHQSLDYLSPLQYYQNKLSNIL
jgi:transposase InsO family protein